MWVWRVCGKPVTGILRPRGWGFTALTMGAGPLPLPETLRAGWSWELLPWCKDKNNFSSHWDKLVWLRKVGAEEAHGQAEPLSLFLAPCGQLCRSGHGLLFNLRGLLLVITACRHWERFSPGLLGGVSLEKDEEGGGRKVLLWILQPFSANSCNYRLCVLSQWHIIQQKPFLIETLQEVQIPPLFSLTN